MAIQVKVPALGESVKQAKLLKWHKNDGDTVRMDEPLCELETDKANVDVPAESPGVVRRLKKEGDTVDVGETIAEIDPTAAPKSPSKPTQQPKQAQAETPAAIALEDFSPAVRRLLQENKLDPKSIPPTGPGNRLTKEDVQAHLDARKKTAGEQAQRPESARGEQALRVEPARGERAQRVESEKKKDAPASAPASTSASPIAFDADGIHREPMSKIRRRIAETLVQAQQTAAILTTFNEVDLSAVIELRNKYKEIFQETYGVGLGFMSFFARAVVLALKDFPRVNAFLDGDNVVYHQYVHLGIAVSTDRGLAVPVLRNVQSMSFAKIETEIKRLATATREGKLAIEELSGGTFTITNGGIFGSLLSTPILNPPQSGILGMHAIQKRPVVVNDKIEIRSMMYIALSYDHRLVDGRESVSFLVRLKQCLEDPARLMLQI